MKKTALTLLMAAFAVSFAATGGRRTHTAPPRPAVADTLQPKDTLAPDTTIAPDSLQRALMDSTFRSQGAITVDTITLAQDTLKGKKDGLDAPVQYEAEDSIVYDAERKIITLYNKAKVKYQDMTLDAGVVTMSLDSNLVHARLLPDSMRTDTVQSRSEREDLPTYKQGNDMYQSGEMSFNFKTK
ncbi:MAG: LPS-assembly protein LptD, partial [Alloprevotella sp.]|nr:LPS-assembly protein LptD [Alloprevotella sp.]